ncbi:hypothetical protein BaRGS_00033562 [Batillaria attramentaria]|uniref:PDZ domain-containing protein n=1 Tax=Batillaria attramentaria TaxID=370345 RepID=A0ABD0JJV2_9CAEN
MLLEHLAPQHVGHGKSVAAVPSGVSEIQINPNSKAYNEGIIVGDIINEINRQKTHGLNYNDAQQLIKNSTDQLLLEISR